MNPRTLPCIVMLLAFGFVGCATQSSQTEPQTGPPGVDIEYHGDDSDSSSDETASDDAAKSDDKESTKADEKGDEKSAAKTSPPPTSCKGLKKTDCEIHMGCAWSTDKVCVEHS